MSQINVSNLTFTYEGSFEPVFLRMCPFLLIRTGSWGLLEETERGKPHFFKSFYLGNRNIRVPLRQVPYLSIFHIM